jgi:hypothetical protein
VKRSWKLLGSQRSATPSRPFFSRSAHLVHESDPPPRRAGAHPAQEKQVKALTKFSLDVRVENLPHLQALSLTAAAEFTARERFPKALTRLCPHRRGPTAGFPRALRGGARKRRLRTRHPSAHASDPCACSEAEAGGVMGG